MRSHHNTRPCITVSYGTPLVNKNTTTVCNFLKIVVCMTVDIFRCKHISVTSRIYMYMCIYIHTDTSFFHNWVSDVLLIFRIMEECRFKIIKKIIYFLEERSEYTAHCLSQRMYLIHALIYSIKMFLTVVRRVKRQQT